MKFFVLASLPLCFLFISLYSDVVPLVPLIAATKPAWVGRIATFVHVISVGPCFPGHLLQPKHLVYKLKHKNNG
jgi:hypothetical protein